MNGPVPVSTNAPVGVYVIDDDPDVVSFIRTILVEAGFRVETETDSTAAMKKKPELKKGCTRFATTSANGTQKISGQNFGIFTTVA